MGDMAIFGGIDGAWEGPSRTRRCQVPDEAVRAVRVAGIDRPQAETLLVETVLDAVDQGVAGCAVERCRCRYRELGSAGTSTA